MDTHSRHIDGIKSMENVKFMIVASMSLIRDAVSEAAKRLNEEVFRPMLNINKANKKSIIDIFDQNQKVSRKL